MTEALPQALVSPPTAVQLSSIEPAVKFLNPEAARIIGFSPVKTVWGMSSGRPVYDRLPAVSGSYVPDAFNGQRIRIFIADENKATGAGTLQVGRWDRDPGILIVQSGTLTWRFGPVDIEALAVKISALEDGRGLPDGEYQVGYILRYELDNSDRYKEYLVEDFSLAASATVYGATAAAEQYPVEVAFTDELDSSWRPNDLGEAGDYDSGEALILDFTEPCKAERFTLTASSEELATAKCSLYWSDDGAIWQLDDRVWESKAGAWDMTVSEQEKHRYWRFFFWGGLVDVRNVSYTGTAYYADPRRTGATTIAEPFIDNRFDEVEGDHIVLATFTVLDGQIAAVEDYRLSQITYENYQPVASWITQFQDESLRRYFVDVENYAGRWMAPPTAGAQLYEELLAEDTFEIGSELSYPRLLLPNAVSLEPGFYFTYDDIDIQIDGEQNFYNDPVLLDLPTPEITTEAGVPIGTGAGQPISLDRPRSTMMYSLKGKSDALRLTTNPEGFQIEGDEVTVYKSSSRIEPYHVTNVGAPSGDGDLSTKAYVDAAFIVNMDNGAYD